LHQVPTQIEFATTIVTLLFLSAILLTISGLALKMIFSYLYRRRLKKIDHTKYRVLGTKNGLPVIFQNIKNPNELKFI
jgi:hypothetical protein